MPAIDTSAGHQAKREQRTGILGDGTHLDAADLRTRDSRRQPDRLTRGGVKSSVHHDAG